MNQPIVYIDESGFAQEMPRRYGYASVGQGCFGQQNLGGEMTYQHHWCITIGLITHGDFS